MSDSSSMGSSSALRVQLGGSGKDVSDSTGLKIGSCTTTGTRSCSHCWRCCLDDVGMGVSEDIPPSVFTLPERNLLNSYLLPNGWPPHDWPSRFQVAA
eukprot:6524324-Pyramimonas_sp.AAC.1